MAYVKPASECDHQTCPGGYREPDRCGEVVCGGWVCGCACHSQLPQGIEVIADATFVSRVNERYPFLWAIQGGKCFYCGVAMSLVSNKSRKRSMATADHFYPKKLGHHREANVVLACSHCNSSAGHDMPTEMEKARFEKMKEQGNIQARRDVNHATPVQMPVHQKRGSFP